MWSEWKEKLTKTFPTVQNYAQLLHDMLNRKVIFNETLETYFYHKMNLLNRCQISGKKAIDCIIYGLEDRSMRLGAQAANYSQPEDLLTYFKSVKIDDTIIHTLGNETSPQRIIILKQFTQNTHHIRLQLSVLIVGSRVTRASSVLNL